MSDNANATLKEYHMLLDEKNKIINELKYLLAQKEETIATLVKKIESSEKSNTMHPQSATVGINGHIDPFSTEENSSDQKNQLIKDLLSIITTQLDFKKISTSNLLIKNLLKYKKGKFRFDDGEYEGEMVAGQPNGMGNTVLDNGDAYTGEYLHGKKNGKGVYKWAGGDVYEGDHVDGLEHGKGVYKYADGDIYVGDYVNGKRHGFGVLKLKSGTTEYGYFRDGQYNGKCIMISPDEQVVSIGELINNKQDGSWNYYDFRESKIYVNGAKV